MKKIFTLAILLAFICPILVFAGELPTQICYDPMCTTNLIELNTGLGNTEPSLIVARIINTALSILGTVALALVFYAGFIWMYARGNEEEITKAKNILQGAFIGLAIIMASYGISYFIFYNLTRISNAV
ncbi:MAG: hypothetical protein V1898_02115 [Patescibacteria group bacterium]